MTENKRARTTLIVTQDGGKKPKRGRKRRPSDPQARLISRARLTVDSGALYSVDTGRPRFRQGKQDRLAREMFRAGRR